MNEETGIPYFENKIRWRGDLDYYVCPDCCEDIHTTYMVKNEIWAAAGYGKRQMAHATCLAKRLGRPLTPDDFTDVPLNDVANSMRLSNG